MSTPAKRSGASRYAAAGAVLLLLCAGSVSVRAALDLDDWVWRTPTPQGNPLVSVAWGAPGFVAVGGAGAVFTSLDGITWSAQDAGTTAYLSGMAWTGTRYVAVGSRGTIVASADGSAWTPVDSGVGAWLRGVRRLGGLVIAVGDEGTILTSPDGLAWTRRSSGVPPWLTLTDVALHVGVPEDRFVAVGDDGMVATSPDGFNWSVATTPTTADLRGVAWGGTQFVAVGKTGSILTSSDGSAWTPQVSGTPYHLSCVAWDGTQFCALGDDGTILTSTNGTTWIPRASGAVSYLRGLAWSGSQFCGVGDFGMIVTSYDGLAWAQQTAYTDVLSSVAWSGTQYCIVGDLGAVLTSVDGSVWSRQDSGTGAWLSGVTYGDGAFVAVGDDGTILASTDGMTWDPRTSGTTAFLSSILWSGTGFLTVGERGTVLTSLNGTAWTAATPVTAEWYSDAAWSGSLYVVVGSNGTIVTSPDAVAWTRQASGTSEFLAGVVWAGAQFVAVGSRGAVLTSADGIAWTPQVSGIVASLTDIVWSGTDLVAAGAAGTVLSSPNGQVWTPRDSRTTQWLHGLNWSGTQFTAVGSRGAITVCATSPATLPSPTWLALNLGDEITRDPALLLYNTCSGTPTDYMASESPSFAGATWVPYLDAPRFQLSAGDGEKTVYFRVRDGLSESIWISDTILLDTTAPVPVLSTLTPDPTRESPFAVTVTFPEPVWGFGLPAGVLVTGGTASGLTETGPDLQWSFLVTPSREGTVTVQVVAGAAEDAAGNPSAAATPLRRLYDGTAPAVSAFQPASGATGVARNATLSITFGETVLPGSGSVRLWRVADGALVETIPVGGAGGVAVSGTTAMIPHAQFSAGVAYYVTVDQGAVTDVAGSPFAGIAGSTPWTFTVQPWTVTFQYGSNGVVTGALVQTVAEGGSTTPVTAVPGTGYRPLRWTELGVSLGNANPFVLPNVTGDHVITAEFEVSTYLVTFAPGANGTVTGTAAQTVAHGAATTPVTAVANPGCHFVRWRLAGGPYSTANPLTITNVTAAMALTADFAIDSYTVLFLAGANGTLSGTTVQVRNYGGTTSAVTAVPDFGYTFDAWDDGNTDNPRVVSPVQSDLTLTALFRPGNPVDPDGTFVTLVDTDDVVAGRGIWDFTGSYAVTVGAGSLALTLVQDGSGRLTGTGTYTTTTLTMTLDPTRLAGSVKGTGNDVVMKLHAMGKQADPTNSNREEIVVIDLLLTLNYAGKSLDGVATIRRGRRAPTTKTESVLNVSLPVPAAMDGTYGIGWDLTLQGTKVAGDAVLYLSNGTQYLLGVSGKQAAAGQPSRITAQADNTDVMGKGIRIQALLGTLEPVGEGRPWWAVLSSVKGKALGQTLAW